MLWTVIPLMMFFTMSYVAHRRRGLVFVSRVEPISVVHLRFTHRTAHIQTALRDASRMLRR